jgi:uncharacterized protein YecT (DUF1311 family)
MLELFPLTCRQIFQLPDLAVDPTVKADTYKGLFLNELLSLEVSAKRNLTPATYQRHADGSANLSMEDTILDVSTFYLFAHKALVSSIFIFTKTIRHDKRRGIGLGGYTDFMKVVSDKKTPTLEMVFKDCGKKLSWAQRAIIDKRDNLVQHWQVNSSNKFFTIVCAWDLPYLIYYNPKELHKIDDTKVNAAYNQVKTATKTKLDESSSDSLQKIAWMEAWQPTLSTQLQTEINSLIDNDTFIALPVTPQLIRKLDETISCLLEEANKLK